MPTKKDVTFGKSHDLSVILEPPILKSSPKFGNYRTPVEKVRQRLGLNFTQVTGLGIT